MAQDCTQRQVTLPPNLERVKQAALRDRGLKFTALLHHVNAESLLRAFKRLKRSAAPGIDGETVSSYERNLRPRLSALCDRVHRGRYRPQPIRRVHIPKSDGGRRPLGILCLEDKIVQGAVAEALSAIYEVDFLDSSYGFRPGRNAHDALAALYSGVMQGAVNWVLDADIRSFFDSMDHELLLRALRLRIADPRVLRLVEQWLAVGVLEDGECTVSEQGTPQGAGISPLLANVYLHYALDLWVCGWQRAHAGGPVLFIRYADDFVMGFRDKHIAERMRRDLGERLQQCRLRLHEDKTRLLEFGRHAAKDRAQRGQGKPETFDFLGFTHYCSHSLKGRFIVKRKTQGKRLRRKLQALGQQMHQRMHDPVRQQHAWLSSVLRGHYAYYRLPCNSRSLWTFLDKVRSLWLRTLRRRDRKRRLTGQRFMRLMTIFPLPRPSDTQPARPVQLALW